MSKAFDWKNSRFSSPFLLPALAGVLALGGCLGIGEDAPAVGGPNLMRSAVFGNPENVQPAAIDPEILHYTCPKVDVVEGGATFRAGGTGAGDVTHQASLIDVARECDYRGKTLVMKIGVEGRMLIGERGRPGTYTVPISIAVKQLDKVVAARVTRVSVTIPAGGVAQDFSHVESNISVPITDSDPGALYDVYVGFDARGSADPKKARRRR